MATRWIHDKPDNTGILIYRMNMALIAAYSCDRSHLEIATHHQAADYNSKHYKGAESDYQIDRPIREGRRFRASLVIDLHVTRRVGESCIVH